MRHPSRKVDFRCNRAPFPDRRGCGQRAHPFARVWRVPPPVRDRTRAGPGTRCRISRRAGGVQANASAHVMVTLAAPRVRTARSSASATPRSRSTITTHFAPREAASKPSAPVPANRSRQRASSTSPASQLNNVSRTRSGVGRIRSVVTTGSRRLLQRPAMMRTAPFDAECFTSVTERSGRVPIGLGTFGCMLRSSGYTRSFHEPECFFGKPPVGGFPDRTSVSPNRTKLPRAPEQ